MTDTRPISARLPNDLANELERTRLEDTRTRTDQIEHLLRVGLAGRERLKQFERLASAGVAQANTPNSGSAAAAGHLAEHARLCAPPSDSKEA